MKKDPLYQVMVEQDGELTSVFPRVVKEVAEQLVSAINAQISLGREKRWSNPHIAVALF